MLSTAYHHVLRIINTKYDIVACSMGNIMLDVKVDHR